MFLLSFSMAEMMKLRDGRYAFGLLATIDGVQLVLAVSRALRKEEGRLFCGPGEQEPPLLDGGRDEALLEGANGSSEEDVEWDGDAMEAAETENDEDDGFHDGENQMTGAVGAHLEGRADVCSVCTEAGAGSAGSLNANRCTIDVAGSHVPPKKAASRRVALSALAGPTATWRTRWWPCIDDATFCSVAIAVLAVLRRRGPRSRETLLAPTVAALSRHLMLSSMTPHDALIDILRLLVRTSWVVRCRERLSCKASGPQSPPTYALTAFGLRQLQIGHHSCDAAQPQQPWPRDAVPLAGKLHVCASAGAMQMSATKRLAFASQNPVEPGTLPVDVPKLACRPKLMSSMLFEEATTDAAEVPKNLEEPTFTRKGSEASISIGSQGKVKYRISRKRSAT